MNLADVYLKCILWMTMRGTTKKSYLKFLFKRCWDQRCEPYYRGRKNDIKNQWVYHMIQFENSYEKGAYI